MKGLTDRNKSLIALVFVAFSYALMSVVSRWLSLGFEPFTQVYLRLFGAFAISCLIFRKDIKFKKIMTVPKHDWIPLITMGVLGYGMMVYFVTMGSLNTSLLNVSVILAIVPFFSYLLGMLFLKDAFDYRIMMLATMSLVGVSIIASNSLIPSFSRFGQGEIFVLTSAFLLATYSVGRKLLSQHLNNKEITVSVIFLAFITTFILAMIKGEELVIASFSMPIVFAGLLIGSTLNIFCTFLESYSFQKLPVVVGNQILLLENLFSPLLGFFLYREGMGMYQLTGALVIIGSVYLNNRFSAE